MSKESTRVKQTGNRRRRQKVAFINDVMRVFPSMLLVGVVKDGFEKVMEGMHAVQEVR